MHHLFLSLSFYLFLFFSSTKYLCQIAKFIKKRIKGKNKVILCFFRFFIIFILWNFSDFSKCSILSLKIKLLSISKFE